MKTLLGPRCRTATKGGKCGVICLLYQVSSFRWCERAAAAPLAPCCCVCRIHACPCDGSWGICLPAPAAWAASCSRCRSMIECFNRHLQQYTGFVTVLPRTVSAKLSNCTPFLCLVVFTAGDDVMRFPLRSRRSFGQIGNG